MKNQVPMSVENKIPQSIFIFNVMILGTLSYIDMNKGYRVEWEFVLGVMRKMGFAEK